MNPPNVPGGSNLPPNEPGNLPPPPNISPSGNTPPPYMPPPATPSAGGGGLFSGRNIVIGLIAQQVTGQSYGHLLSTLVFRPAALTQTTFPTRRISLPSPFIHGYKVRPRKQPQDVTTWLSPSGAWASGAIVSTPADLGAFVRADLGGRFFGPAQRAEQLRFVRGSSSPAGPGTNSAGLAIFRYKTRCGTVYGHTGNFPGYVQWAAATADGRRSVTTSLNIAAPRGALLAQLRSVQASAVCALLGK